MTNNRYSHIDLTVNCFATSLPFYEKILPALGFTRTFHSEKWKVFAGEGDLPEAPYFAITESAGHQPNGNLIGFWAKDHEEVDAFARLVVESGGKIEQGPGLFPISPSYYAVYFQDPSGNRYEFLHRLD